MSSSLKICIGLFLLTFTACIDEPEAPNTDLLNPSETQNQPPGRRGGPGNADGQENGDNNNEQPDTTTAVSQLEVLQQSFGQIIDLNNLPNYTNQAAPQYITKDNSQGVSISNEGALLGRVLFYDKNLSVNNSISCASCHQQANAFSDPDQLSEGVAGRTGRHSMRLINVQYATERRFFWDERAVNLEDQTLQPVQDHIEMGFSGTNGDPEFGDLIQKLSNIGYYNDLFAHVYGSPEIAASKMEDALAQFIRSIRSFDSRFDIGRRQVNNINAPFPNFTTAENRGKALFMARPINGPNGRQRGGLGCQGCHRGPEFDIDPNSRNNGVTGMPGERDFSITRSPTLRDLFDNNGNLNTPLMHTGDFSIDDVLDHYNAIPNIAGNNNLDRRLRGQRLNMTQQERSDLIAFLKTLSGRQVYTDPKLGNPFSQ